MIILSCKDIKKSFGIDEILNNISFSLNEGEKASLIGANGTGKSTLFKILTGELEEDSGEIFIDKRKTLGYLSQHLSLDESKSIFDEMLSVFEDLIKIEKRQIFLEDELKKPYNPDNEIYHNKLITEYTQNTDIYANRGGYTYKGDISRVLKGLGFLDEDFNKNINILSGGQKTRLALCKLLLKKPDILLLDEPTNHLDLEAIEWLESYLNSYNGSVLLISHDRYFLDSITNKTFELTKNNIKEYSGNYSYYIKRREIDYELELKAYKGQQEEIKRQEEIIERYRSFNREKSIKAAESRQKALDKIEILETPTLQKKLSKIKFTQSIVSGNDVLHIENLSKSFKDKHLFQSINTDVKRGEKIALIGDNGIGKTTLFKMIMDKESTDNGIIYLGKNVFIGYYDQEQSDLHSEKSILDEVWDIFPKMPTKDVRSVLGSFLFSGEMVFRKIANLSGGEKCRINLLKLMLSKSNFLLLDEPTNHLDIVSREALEEAILDYPGTILTISHDRYFLNKISEKILELKENEMKVYLGNYDYYIEKKKNPLRFENTENQNGKTKTQMNIEKKKKKQLDKNKQLELNKIKEIEKTIASLELEIDNLNEDLCKEEVYTDIEEANKINNLIKEKEILLTSKYEEWEKLI